MPPSLCLSLCHFESLSLTRSLTIAKYLTNLNMFLTHNLAKNRQSAAPSTYPPALYIAWGVLRHFSPQPSPAPGWLEEIHATGKSYYINTATQQAQWDRPALPPPPPNPPELNFNTPAIAPLPTPTAPAGLPPGMAGQLDSVICKHCRSLPLAPAFPPSRKVYPS